MSYAMKYAAKQSQKEVPKELENVGRFWGVSGCRDVVVASTVVEGRDWERCRSTHRRMMKCLRRACASGKAKMYVDESGVKVALITGKKELSELNAFIHLMMAKTTVRPSIFEDCDIDIEGY